MIVPAGNATVVSVPSQSADGNPGPVGNDDCPGAPPPPIVTAKEDAEAIVVGPSVYPPAGS